MTTRPDGLTDREWLLSLIAAKTWKGLLKWTDCEMGGTNLPEWLAEQKNEHGSHLSAYRFAMISDQVGVINGGSTLFVASPDEFLIFDECFCSDYEMGLVQRIDKLCWHSVRLDIAPCEVVADAMLEQAIEALEGGVGCA